MIHASLTIFVLDSHDNSLKGEISFTRNDKILMLKGYN